MQNTAKNYSSKPKVPNAHMFGAGERSMVLSVDQGLIYELEGIVAEVLDQSMNFGDTSRVNHLLGGMGIDVLPVTPEPAPESVEVNSLSLAVAQKCNLGCTYCYAEQGDFGGNSKSMSIGVAKASIDQLLQNVSPAKPISLAFLGGEPLVNREVLQAATKYAAEKAETIGANISFSITTNGTLLKEEDAEFFNKYNFTVTVSLDGVKEKHDALRPYKSGKGSYSAVIERVRFLLDNSPSTRVNARVTVTPENLDLSETLVEFTDMGFESVMFSPVLNSPNGQKQLAEDDFEKLLHELIECGKMFEEKLLQEKVYPFSNIIKTIQRIHNYKRDAYPCGAGGGYMGVSSEGELYACHRFVDDEKGRLGDVFEGVDRSSQKHWLKERNVHRQEPCRSCWARHLCGGSCHHEAIYRGRPACDYIRGWLHYCLSVYVKLSKQNPSMLHRILNSN